MYSFFRLHAKRIGNSRQAMCAGIFALIVATGAVPAKAAILRIGSNVSTSVQELIDQNPGSVNSDEKQLGVDAERPPIFAAASLSSTDLEDRIVSMAQGLSRFDDPTTSADANPRELSLEIACYSNASSVAYHVEGNVEETRTIVFTRPGSEIAPTEIEFRSDGTREVESRVFLSGAVILWSTFPLSEGVELTGAVSLTVEREGESSLLFDTALQLVGKSTGLETTVSGPLVVDEVDLDELAELGVDEATLAILGELAEGGFLGILVLPDQQHVYRYMVTADESFDLDATLTAEIHNAPAGTGLAVVVGRPFERLADFIEMALPGVDGAAVERSINAAKTKRGPLVIKPAEPPSNRLAPFCGAMGLETGLLLALFVSFSLVSPQRRRTIRRRIAG